MKNSGKKRKQRMKDREISMEKERENMWVNKNKEIWWYILWEVVKIILGEGERNRKRKWHGESEEDELC